MESSLCGLFLFPLFHVEPKKFMFRVKRPFCPIINVSRATLLNVVLLKNFLQFSFFSFFALFSA